MAWKELHQASDMTPSRRLPRYANGSCNPEARSLDLETEDGTYDETDREKMWRPADMGLKILKTSGA